ncbi:hypothetical protein BCR34DRAFT_614241 [Clohesyomyces aquaticus]|uniref:Azaphilone pigments biosynthesis cluster protein L N-terminal domain-containing protein n=1 Tax=Clohesyomyces aquaticus TaxID=1231657 RepID=A0A1Y1ZP48_9PLEO|nr:hypothetical protein BCR34DRAFT_614241 [Clohesyomyces aquaticus]
MGRNISGFKDMLEICKGIITIVIAGVNMRTITVTETAFKGLQEKLDNMKTDFEDRLVSLNTNLDNLRVQGSSATNKDMDVEEEKIRDDIDCTNDSLALCIETSKQVEKKSMNVFENVSAAQDAHQVIVSTVGDLIAESESMQVLEQDNV